MKLSFSGELFNWFKEMTFKLEDYLLMVIFFA